jgi:prevent-host-death family protein
MAQKTDSRAEPTRTTTISVTDFRNHLAKYLELAHYSGQYFLVERNHESFVVMLGVEEYRRLMKAGEQRG